jgi:Ras-related protein Rab-14
VLYSRNKCDLGDTDSRAVTQEEGQAFADENEMDFLETSAKTGTNVERAFIQTAAAVCQKVKDHKIDVGDPQSGVKLNKEMGASQKGRAGNNGRISVSNKNGAGNKKKGCC